MILHPSLFDLQGFICGDLPESVCWQVIAHLADGCKPCLAEVTVQLNLLFEIQEGADSMSVEVEQTYDEAIGRVFDAIYPDVQFAQEENARAEHDLILLEEKSAAGFVEASTYLGGLATYWALLRRMEAVRFEDPQEMVRLGHLANLVAEQLDLERFGVDLVLGFRCRAVIELSNAYRVADDLVEAETLLGEAAELYECSGKDQLLGARLFDVQASLLGAYRRFKAACGALDTVYKTYLECGDPHLAGRALIKKALYTSYDGDSETSLDLIQEALTLIDPERDSSLMLLALHNKALFLVECGRYRDSRALLWKAFSRFGQTMGKVQRLKFRWIEGKANAGLQEFDRAEQALFEVRQGFKATGLPYKSALVTLELAMVALRRGHAEKAKWLVLEAAQVFEELDIRREVLASVLLLRKAFETQTITLELLEDMYKFLDRAETDPVLTLKAWLSDARQA